MKQYFSYSEEETKRLGRRFAKKFKHGIVALIGELGAGKTTFIQGFAKGLGIKDKIISPTFVLIRQHKIPNSNLMLLHVDLYRLERKLEIKSLGLSEILSNSNNVVLIEWAEKARGLLPENTKHIKFQIINQNKRKITIS